MDAYLLSSAGSASIQKLCLKKKSGTVGGKEGEKTLEETLWQISHPLSTRRAALLNKSTFQGSKTGRQTCRNTQRCKYTHTHNHTIFFMSLPEIQTHKGPVLSEAGIFDFTHICTSKLAVHNWTRSHSYNIATSPLFSALWKLCSWKPSRGENDFSQQMQ